MLSAQDRMPVLATSSRPISAERRLCLTSGKADEPPEKKPGGSPKVLFQESAAPEPVAAAKATGQPKVLFGAPRAPAPKGDRPRVLAAGEVRRRISCGVTDLQNMDADATEAVAKAALRIVDATNLDDHYFDDVVRFGASLQAEHGRLTERELAIVSSEAVAAGRRLAAELVQRLTELDPDRVFAVRGGFLDTVKALTASRDPAGLFSRLYPEVRALAMELDGLAPDIAVASSQVRDIGKIYKALSNRLAAHILAGRFLIHHIGGLQLPDPERQAHYASQAEALETRTSSLSATKATIEMSIWTVAAVSDEIKALASAAEGLLQEDLPAWHAAYSAALTAARNAQSREQDATRAPLRNVHTRILGKLRLERNRP
jgi:hypothetical protein